MTRIDNQRPLTGPMPPVAAGAGPAPAAGPVPAQLHGDSAAIANRPSGLLSGLSGLVSRVKDALASDIAQVGHAAGAVIHGVEENLHEVGDAASQTISDLKAGKIQAVLSSALYGVDSKPFETRVVEDDPTDVNSTQGDELLLAKTQLQAHKGDEATALGKLSEPERKTYQAVAASLESNSIARAALETMLLDGRLPGARDLKATDTLLGQLGHLTTEELGAGIDRAQLLNDTVRELENPVRIDQHAKNTCGATTAQILVARKHPAEYARLIAGLASKEGKVQAAGGATLKRPDDWNADNDGGRSISSRLIQPPLMQQAQTFEVYHNATDLRTLGPITDLISRGMFGLGSAQINTQLEGVSYQNHMMVRGHRDAVWNQVKDALNQGKGPIPVDLTWDDGGHFVQIDRIAAGRVHYTNPWGQTESMTEAEFLQHVMEAQIPKK